MLENCRPHLFIHGQVLAAQHIRAEPFQSLLLAGMGPQPSLPLAATAGTLTALAGRHNEPNSNVKLLANWPAGLAVGRDGAGIRRRPRPHFACHIALLPEPACPGWSAPIQTMQRTNLTYQS